MAQNATFHCIPQQQVKTELDILTLREIFKATEQLKRGKTADINGIPPEIWKHGGLTLDSKLHELLIYDALITTLHVHVYKNKGE